MLVDAKHDRRLSHTGNWLATALCRLELPIPHASQRGFIKVQNGLSDLGVRDLAKRVDQDHHNNRTLDLLVERIVGVLRLRYHQSTTEITLADFSTGRTLGSYTVTGESGGSGLAGGTSEAVTKTAEAVAGLLGGSAVR